MMHIYTDAGTVEHQRKSDRNYYFLLYGPDLIFDSANLAVSSTLLFLVSALLALNIQNRMFFLTDGGKFSKFSFAAEYSAKASSRSCGIIMLSASFSRFQDPSSLA
mmetsp:Transcript_12273/g.19811  ORF Transcript_12273/g.19811 Transcript_12273/m.19811 type:complete len:106 (+) Transcript_12273:161-478(+)